jgi:RNA recognition motif-containing protein
MRPAQKKIAPDVWIVREQACFKFQKPLFLEHPNLVLRPLPFRRSQSDSLLLSFPKRERYIYMSMKLYVGNLAFQTSSSELQQLFASAGTVESANVVEDRDTGRSRGFGFVEMSNAEEGAKAIAEFNGKELNGRALKVNEARPRENRNGGGRSSAGGFRGNRSGGGGRDFGGRNDRTPRW